MKIYHNPRCTKSRQTLALLKENGVEPEIIEYLKEPLSKLELMTVLKKLNFAPSQLLRKNEAAYKEKIKNKSLSDEEIVELMLAHPKLIERPIVVKGEKAVLGRPPENALALI